MAADPNLYNRGPSRKGLSFYELLNLIEEDDRLPQTIAICPPDEPLDAETDKDSDLSDEEVRGNVDHLPRRILRSEVIVRYDDEVCDASNCEENRQSHSLMYDTIALCDQEQKDDKLNKPSTSKTLMHAPKRRKKGPPADKSKFHPSQWHANVTEIIAPQVPEYEADAHPTAEDFLKEIVKSPVEALRVFLTQELLQHIVSETNRYAAQKLNHSFGVTPENILTFIGVMLLSGYHPLPYRRLYWSFDPDVHCDLVSNAIRRNSFDEIMAHLHLANNEANDGSDKLYKVRPLFDMLNASFKQVSPGPNISMDETIIPYYGRHGIKQFIKGKPIRFGFKLWVAADPSGYILHAEPYCGISTRLPESGLGQGGDVVLGLLDYVKAKPGTKLYFDNLFTSVGLLHKLNEKKIGATGTLRENRCSANMKLPEKKAFHKTPRGAMASSGTDSILALRWNDNSVVTVLSNCDNIHPMQKSNRYCRTQKSKVSVNVPGPIAKYNSCMGGVDLADQFVASYRSRIRSKKWWWPLFAWAIDISCVQGWLLYRRLGHNIPLLNFRRECAIYLLKSFGTAPKVSGVHSSLQFSPALENIRKDRTDHVIEKGASKYRRCKVCGSRTTYLCGKCDVPLHPENCFKSFHVK